MTASWDEYAYGWDLDPRVVEYAAMAFDTLGDVIHVQDLRVLDFGCGTGLLTEKIAATASSVVAIDASSNMIEVLTQKNIGNVVAISSTLSKVLIDENPVFDSGFDLVIASSVLAFVPDYEQTLLAIKSVIKPGGTFIQWDWKQNNTEDFGFTQERITTAYQKVGFSLVQVCEPFSLASGNGEMHVLMGVAKHV